MKGSVVLLVAGAALGGLATWTLATATAVTNFESAYRHLQSDLLPAINLSTPPSVAMVNVGAAARQAPAAGLLPSVDSFPVYGDASPPGDQAATLTLEIVSSAEKADGLQPDRRWLVDVAERFNQRRERNRAGQRLQVRIRTITSGLAAQLLLAGKLKPAGYTPMSEQLLDLLADQGLPTNVISPSLVSNGSVIAVRQPAYQRLRQLGAADFGAVVNQTLAGQLRLGYANPYISSVGLDFLHTLLWTSAGHHRDGRPLAMDELSRPQVKASFELFQHQMAASSSSYLELIDLWKQRPESLDALIMDRRSYWSLRREANFADLMAIPFGGQQSSPLAAFSWTTAAERDALQRFAAFARSASMQDLARRHGFGSGDATAATARPPRASGAVLAMAQRQWKQRKDGRRTVYMQLVIDTSGSMAKNERLSKLKQAVIAASQTINFGHYVGLVTFNDAVVRQLPLQPFDGNGKQRLLAAVQQLQPDGGTALYDGLAVGLADLMKEQRRDPKGRYYLVLLTDGQPNRGLNFGQLRPIIQQSGVRIIPIAYGEVNAGELGEIAAIRESPIYTGKPELIVSLMTDLFQTSL
jgi:Ca-activated chloride channel family protein